MNMFNRLAVLFALLALFSAPRIFAGPAWQAARAAPADEEPQVFMGGGLNAGLEPPEDSGYAESRGVEEKTAWGAPSGIGIEGEKPPEEAAPASGSGGGSSNKTAGTSTGATARTPSAGTVPATGQKTASAGGGSSNRTAGTAATGAAVRTPSAGTAPATGQKTASASAGGGSPNKTGGNPTGAATKSSSNTSGAKASGSAGTGEPADFSLDGKLVFAISGTFMLGTGLGGGGTITIWEKHSLRRFFSPSIFVTAKYFAIDDRKRFFAGGAGILFKRRLTRNERLLLNLGLSLEYLGGSVEHPRYPDYYEPIDFSSFGMGVQGGLSWRCTPNISLDLNGLVKFGFGSVNLDYVCAPDESYTPLAGGVELGITFMLPY